MIFRKFDNAEVLLLLHSCGNWKDTEEALNQDKTTFSADL